MRYLLTLLFVLIDLSVLCQAINLGDPIFKGDIVSVIEKSPEFKNDWREFSFDSLSHVIEKKYFRDSVLLQTDKWSYVNQDSIFITTEYIQNNFGLTTHKTKCYYDSDKRLVKYELYNESLSSIPLITELNMIYVNGLLKQYDRILQRNGDTTVIEKYKLDYYNDNTKIVVIKSDNKNLSRETTILKLNKRGDVVDKIVDCNNPLCALTDIRPYSRNRPDKYEIKYKYDKFGNWIQSYFVTRLWRYKRDERKIKYK